MKPNAAKRVTKPRKKPGPKPGQKKRAGGAPTFAKSVKQAAALSGFDARFLEQVRDAGCPAWRSNRIYFGEISAWVTENKDKLTAAQKSAGEAGTLKEQKEAADLRKAIAQAERIEIQNAESKRLLVRASDYERDIRAIQATVQSALDAFPARVAPDVAGLSAPEAEKVLKAEIARMIRGFKTA